ncbi:unnamed protein product [Effrenium voratum]|uniref:Uncharacterized protein n=1 Tax=Effrenium voratum TaxID=2562239 RepID=A0AA36HZB7_9DINO|nr:unnamed protein product [Effrenium voratum]CAJ1426047.1 unnamed protein product [Effrenium voratum]
MWAASLRRLCSRLPITPLPTVRAVPGARTFITARTFSGSFRPLQGSPPAPAHQKIQCRSYRQRLEKLIPHFRNRTNVLKQEIKQRTTKAKNHAEVLKRFRLSRFGWERRRARLRDGKRRRRKWQNKLNAKAIDYVHRADMLKMIRTAVYFKLRVRDFPRDPNPNLREARQMIGSHFA